MLLPSRLASSQLGVTALKSLTSMGRWTLVDILLLVTTFMGRWTGVQIMLVIIIIPSLSRYDSEGKYLDSLPDLPTPRFYHSCTSFLTSSGEQVKISTSCPILFLLCFKQALLVAGGYNSAKLTSTEIFTDGKWSAGGNLPR